MSVEASAKLPSPKKKSTKDYSRVTRVYDTDGYRLRADALCFKDEQKQEVCVITVIVVELQTYMLRERVLDQTYT